MFITTIVAVTPSSGTAGESRIVGALTRAGGIEWLCYDDGVKVAIDIDDDTLRRLKAEAEASDRPLEA